VPAQGQAMHNEILDLREIIVFLFAAGIIVPLVRRLKISPVFGFLIVGMAIGPYGLVRFSDAAPWLGMIMIGDPQGVRVLAEMGVVFLLFMIGLELSLDRLWAMRRRVFGLGTAQILISGAVIAVVAWSFGNPIAISIVLGASFALSSTAIVMQLLAENRRLGTATGQTSFAILLCQDLAVLPVLFLIGVLGQQSDTPVLAAFGRAMGEALVAAAAIYVIGRLAIRPVFRFVGNTASREMFVALVLLIVLGTAWITEHFGLSMALGAFLAGLLLAETEYRHEIAVDIEPFKGLLVGLFFISIGMSIDIAQVAEDPVWLIVSVAGMYLIKSPIVYVLTRLFGESRPVALEAGLLLGQAGEFAFVAIGMALAVGLMPNDTAQFMLIVASLTMMSTPLVAHVARRLARALEVRDAGNSRRDADIPIGLTGHVIVVGYGRVGQMLGSILDSLEIPHVGLDNDAGMVGRFRRTGMGVYFGDASRAELLQKFGADGAAALVVTMDNPHIAEHVVRVARRHWPELPIYARARDAAHAARLIDRGASHVIPEIVEASLQLGEMVLTGVGIPDETARRVIEVRRQVEQLTVDQRLPNGE
jgi:monovalent cation:proton antiporter-2 (CPA2) family protein